MTTGLSSSRIEIQAEHNARRSSNDVEMVPDRGFRKQLKTLDPELEVVWDRGTFKWEIWRFPKDGKPPMHQMTVQTRDRSYRALGADVLLKLQQCDPWRFSRADLLAYFDELDNQVRRRKEKAFREKMKALAYDTFAYAQNIMQVSVPRKFKISNAARV